MISDFISFLLESEFLFRENKHVKTLKKIESLMKATLITKNQIHAISSKNQVLLFKNYF